MLNKQLTIGTLSLGGEPLTQYVKHNNEVILVSEVWERKGIKYVSDVIDYPIKINETELHFDGVLSGKEVLKLMEFLSHKGYEFYTNALIEYNRMDIQEQEEKLLWLESLEIGKSKDMSPETELLLMQYEA